MTTTSTLREEMKSINPRILIYEYEIRQARKKLDEQYYSKNKCPDCSAPYDFEEEK